jgi:hypothetical protein
VEFTFGIITGGGCDDRITKIISSIEALSIPKYEILIVGQCEVTGNHVKKISFDENVKKAWITKKKNLITENAQYENVVYLHDYIIFNENWYTGFMQFGNDFDAVVCKIRNLDESRYRDWCLWSRNHSIIDWIVFPNRTLIPYEFTQVRSHLYFSGAFWVAKKRFMETFPLNENLTAGEAEDVEWSKRVQAVTQLRLNTYSEVSFLKNNLIVIREPGRFRLFCIKIFLGTKLYELDKIYKRIPSKVEIALYSALVWISKKLQELKRSKAKS